MAGPEAVRSRGGDESQRDLVDRVRRTLEAAGGQPVLVGFDANGIQELVTAASRPVAMAGASAMVKAFDRWSSDRAESIFGGGGRGLWVVGGEARAEQARWELEAKYHELTQGGVLACAFALLSGRSGADQSAALKQLRARLGRAKDEARPPHVELAQSRGEQCRYCQLRRATETLPPPPDESEPHCVCSRCHDAVGLGGKSARRRGEGGQTLEDLASEAGKVAVVSADGNNMGALFADVDSLERYAATSRLVDEIFQGSHEAALEQIEPRLSLVTGGDDIRAVLPSNDLTVYVTRLAEELHERACRRAQSWQSVLGEKLSRALGGVGIGIGAVVAPFHYPAQRLLEYAHDYERSAKAICDERCRSAFDFTVLTSGNELLQGLDESWAVAVPGDDWALLRRKASALALIPKAQLAQLLELRGAELEERTNLFRYQVARSRDWQRWFETIGRDWRDPSALDAELPSPRLMALAELEPRRPAAGGNRVG